MALEAVNLGVIGWVVLLASSTHGQWTPAQEATYVQRFETALPRNSSEGGVEPYVSQGLYDALYTGSSLQRALGNLDNESGGLAWGLAYRMMSLNEMYRVSGDTRYLEANRNCVDAVLQARDDRRGVKLWRGVIAPVWGSSKYARRGRAAFAVHTGMITFPILDFLLLARADARFRSGAGGDLEAIATVAEESVAYHDRQWRDGPAPGEGHYVGLDEEEVFEGKPLPANQQSAMGSALWLSWKVNHSESHRNRALALGRYIKNRLTAAPDGAYYWPYVLPSEPTPESTPKESMRAEDTSHAALTAALPMLLARDSAIFGSEDLVRLGKTATQGFARRNDGILFGEITGNPDSNPDRVQLPARWLALAPFVPEVGDRIERFYRRYVPRPGPLDLALLLRWKKSSQ